MSSQEAPSVPSAKSSSTSVADQIGIMIGNRRMGSRYFLAPLAGYTQLAFRTAMREQGGMGLATTDLVLATHLIHNNRKSTDLVRTWSVDSANCDRPLTVQIFGSQIRDLVRAAKWLVDRGYEGVDLNMGCPMAKINGNGGGARLMCDAQGARATAEALVQAVEIPVTIKMRLGWDRETITAPELARQFEDVGIAAVTVHGRTRSQGFGGRVSLEGIASVVDAVSTMPIIGNGDVLTPEDALHMRKVTGCDAVAIGRGAMMDPWIFRKIDQMVQGQSVTEPTKEEQIGFLRRHFALMCELHPRDCCFTFRKFAAWYGARLGIPEELEDRLRRFESLEEFEEIVDMISERHGERENQIPTALIKLPNGPIEHW